MSRSNEDIQRSRGSGNNGGGNGSSGDGGSGRGNRKYRGGKYIPPKQRVNGSEIVPKQSVDEEDEKKRRQRAARFNKTPATSQQYGYVSRGEDNRLQKSRSEREKFFKSVVNQFVQYCDETPKASLSKELQMFVDNEEAAGSKQQEKSKNQYSIETILSSLRKLREALLNTSPDKFSIKVFLFSVRISATIGHYQTYIPSIGYLLKGDARKLLTAKEIEELVTLLILHLSHFNNYHTRAIETFNQYFAGEEKGKNRALLTIITSWYMRDFNTWVRFYNSETDNSRSRIMRFGIAEIVNCIITTINKSYFTIDSQFLHEILPNGIDFNVLVTQYSVPWKLKDKTIVVKERNVK